MNEASGEIAIRVEELSKCYNVYEDPKDRLKQAIIPRLRRLVGLDHLAYYREFWALRDVDLVVKRGSTAAIIGRNGSGKSTLLQIICGTLTPSSGTVEVNGKVAALLELGSGFNPEFTGRENVFLNASVLGLSRSQVNARFSAIEQFAGIGQFIDQPIRTYSSGMVVRLAFAVIAHVDADILVIDEALAVGDAVFTQKCMRFLRSFKEKGTILFVSHDMGSVLSLCDSAIWLDKGAARIAGESKDVANAYQKFCAQEAAGEGLQFVAVKPSANVDPRPSAAAEVDPVEHGTTVEFFGNVMNSDGWSTGAAEILAVHVRDAAGLAQTTFAGGERLLITIEAVAHQPLSSPILGILVKDRTGQALFGHNTYQPGVYQPAGPGERMTAVFEFDLPLLPNGSYSLTAAVAEGTVSDNVQHHWLHDALLINVVSATARYGIVGIPFHRRSLSLHADP